MKIKVLPLVSSLHDQNVITELTSDFLKELEKQTNMSFIIERNIDELYKDSDLSLLLVQTGGSENYFLRDFPKIKFPLYLLTYGFSNSLAAAIEILSFVNNSNLKGEILHGSAEYIASRIKKIVSENVYE